MRASRWKRWLPYHSGRTCFLISVRTDQWRMPAVRAVGQRRCGYSATQVAYDYMIGYHGTAATGSGFGTSTVWQDVDYLSAMGSWGLHSLGQYTFFPAQYVALNTWSTIGRSEYHAMQLTLRKRMSNGLAFAVNYTLSKSLDHSSTPERQEPTGGFFTGGYTGTAINAWEPDLEVLVLRFRHAPPVERVPHLGASVRTGSALGFRGVRFRQRSSSAVGRSPASCASTPGCRPMRSTVGRGRPTGTCRAMRPALRPDGTQLRPGERPVPGDPDHERRHQRRRERSPIRTSLPNPDEAIKSFRFSAMGERGQRNVLRGDSYASVDHGLHQVLRHVYSEAHKLAVRLEIFNLTNTPYFDTGSLNHEPRGPRHVWHLQRHAGRATAHAGISAVRLLETDSDGIEGAASSSGAAPFSCTSLLG